MGADYMLIPLMAAKQFGVNSLARAMAVILPVNTIGQTWVPAGVSFLRESFGSYIVPMEVVLGIAIAGAISILLLPRESMELPAEVPTGQSAAVPIMRRFTYKSLEEIVGEADA